jgi:hypothetical protein
MTKAAMVAAQSAGSSPAVLSADASCIFCTLGALGLATLLGWSVGQGR